MSQQQWVAAQFAKFVLNFSSKADSHQQFLSFWKPVRNCRVSWMRLPCFVQPLFSLSQAKKDFGKVFFYFFFLWRPFFCLLWKAIHAIVEISLLSISSFINAALKNAMHFMLNSWKSVRIWTDFAGVVFSSRIRVLTNFFNRFEIVPSIFLKLLSHTKLCN